MGVLVYILKESAHCVCSKREIHNFLPTYFIYLDRTVGFAWVNLVDAVMLSLMRGRCCQPQYTSGFYRWLRVSETARKALRHVGTADGQKIVAVSNLRSCTDIKVQGVLHVKHAFSPYNLKVTTT